MFCDNINIIKSVHENVRVVKCGSESDMTAQAFLPVFYCETKSYNLFCVMSAHILKITDTVYCISSVVLSVAWLQ